VELAAPEVAHANWLSISVRRLVMRWLASQILARSSVNARVMAFT